MIWIALSVVGCQKNEGSLLEGDIIAGSGSARATAGSGSSAKPNPKDPQASDIDLDSKVILARAEGMERFATVAEEVGLAE